jgi:hypothetical protein
MQTLKSCSMAVTVAVYATLALPVPGSGQGAPDQPVQIVIQNHAYLDMHVYVVDWGGAVQPLGMVLGFTTDTLDLRPPYVGSAQEIQFLADPIGGLGSYVSDPVVVDPGDEVDLQIQNNLNLSSLSLRRVR